MNKTKSTTPLVLWFTGLSGSGKSTIADQLKNELKSQGKKIAVLDGDIVRSTINKKLGFSREDIKENNRLIAELANKRLLDHDLVIVPIISPYREDRIMAKSIIGSSFREIFINAPLNECINRDVKGLYKKALSGEIKDFIGVAESNPYEPPEKPDLEIPTSKQTVEESVQRILDYLRS